MEYQQPPQPPAPPSEPPPKRHGVLKGVLIGIGIIVLVVIIIIVVVVLTTDGEQKTTAPEAKVGEPVEAGDLTVTVHGWQPSGGDEFSKPQSGNQYLVVDLEIENNGTETIPVSTILQMEIESADGYEYTPAMYYPEPKYPDGDILPGQKARGNVAFEVPGQVGTIFFVYEPLRGGEVRIKLQ
ncbi:MAG: DUF4352 domain-containing protein [Actinomycetota bacterium]|nr:DUF4352 domain-containing protein [Actinomycetota bacterium]